MKKIILILIILISFKLSAQQSYIIPDIAAPGMNVYYEIIGVFDQKDIYGTEQLYLNNEGDDVRILPVNLADTNKVKFGPFHVSWSGRMISGQVFVNPNANPNSWDWSQLNPQWIIPIQIIKNGAPIANQNLTLYIVKPFNFGDKSANGERVLGEGSLGKRSPRGVMIVDSMVLAPAVYKISTIDCDPVLSGNQGYLPFILLSKGNIKGEIIGNDSTIIRVSSPGREGGPGGGGGGGRFTDNQTGTKGGDGFTGGGNGGVNNIVGGSYENAGVGSGSSFRMNVASINYGGSSINGVDGATCSVTSYESSGGGTGHPFGKSGQASWHPCTACGGGAGGGGGNSNNGKGGSGGFATSALDEPSANPGNGGKSHGNIYGVPIAGGSGGGGGNPQGSFPTFQKKSGWGGGGGGAIRVFGLNIENIRVEADGHDGESGSPDGGAGSGGYIEIGTKENLSRIIVSAARGSNRAGFGRFRFDSRNNFPNIDPINNDLSQTATTSASEFKELVDRKFKLQVKKNQAQVLDYYLKPESGEWFKLFTFNDNSQTNSQFDIDLSAYQDTIFYGMAVQTTISDGTASDYSHIPMNVLSQASGNVFRIAEIELFTEQPRRMHLSSCNETVVYDSLWLKNKGNVLRAEIDTDNHKWDAGDNGFVLLLPSISTVIDQKDSLRVYVRFDYKTGQTGQISNTLTIPYGKNKTEINQEYKIEYIVDVDNLEVEWHREDDSKITDTLALDLCTNETFAESIRVENKSTMDFTVKEVKYNLVEDDYPSLVYTNSLVKVGESFNIQVGFQQNPPQRGLFYNKIYLYVDECSNIVDSLVLKINVKEAFLEQTNGLSIVDYGNVNIVQDKTQTIKIKNNGNTTAYIPSPPILALPFEYISSSLPYPISLQPGEEYEIIVKFSPTQQQSYEQNLELKMTPDIGGCDQTATFKLMGNGVKSNLVFDTPLDWGYVEWCYSRPDSNIIITNNANFDVHIIGSHTITGANPENWSISNNIPTNGTIIPKNGGTINFDIKYDPSVGADGPKSAILKIPTDDVSLPTENDPNAHLIIINLLAYKEGLNVTFNPDPIIDFGKVPINTESIRIPVDITNNSPNSVRTLSHVTPANFKLYNGVNQTFAPGETKTVELAVTVNSVGDYAEDVNFIFDRLACTTTYTLNAKAIGIKGDAIINPKTLDFGILNKCQTNESLTFTIANGGEVDISVIDMTINGTNQTNFNLEPFNKNQAISSTSTEIYTINYIPTPNLYGTFTSNIEILINENGTTNTYSVPTIAEVSKGLAALPSNIDFGQVVSTLNKGEILKINNLHNWNIQFDDLQQLNTNPIFSIDDVIYDNVVNSNSEDISVLFSPPVIGNYTDTLVIPYTIDGYCQDTIRVELLGEGLPSSELTLSIPDQLIDPTSKLVEIPIFAQITNGNSILPLLSLDSLKIRMDKTTFHPENLSFGEVISLSYPTSTELELTMKVDDIQLSDTLKQITSLYAIPLLGERKTSTIEMNNAVLTPNGVVSMFIYDNANVELTICEKGGERLLQNSQNIDLSYSLNDGIININAHIIEQGYNKIQIVNMTGQVMFETEWTREFNGTNEYNFSISNIQYSTGVYLIRLITPNDIITKKLILTK